MNRRSFLCGSVVLGAQGSMAIAPPAVGRDGNRKPSEGPRQIEKATAAAMSMQRRDWEQGILAQALLEAGDRERVILLTKSAIAQRTPDGRLSVVVSSGPTDPAMGGAAYARGGMDRRPSDSRGR